MTFEQMLRRAKDGDLEAITSLLLMNRPLLLKYAVINGRLDEELYQVMCNALMRANALFRILVYEKGPEIAVSGSFPWA